MSCRSAATSTSRRTASSTLSSWATRTDHSASRVLCTPVLVLKVQELIERADRGGARVLDLLFELGDPQGRPGPRGGMFFGECGVHG
jgi:hypothetical protein